MKKEHISSMWKSEVQTQKDISETYLLQQQINTLRDTLVSTALKNGMTNHSVLKISEELDSLIVRYQKLTKVKKAT